MTQPPTQQSGHPMPTPPVPDQDIPTLGPESLLASVPDAVLVALDARAAEKHALMALSEELVQNLRPEIEKLTANLVQKTLADVWEKRAYIYRDTR
jgi:hypothetical protein